MSTGAIIPRHGAGHSFVELLIMLALLGILAVIAVPTSDVGRAGVDALAHRLRSDLHYAQEMAMSTGTSHGFRAVTATSYEIFVGAPGTPAIDPYKQTAFVVNIPDYYRNVQFSGAQPTVTFISTGAPTIAGGPNIVLSDGTATRTLVVTPNTGVVVIQ
ncbi:MAG: hypothetical protein HYV03_03395 [Deltaproteobacteria bacterium]|nr:hypothetical protein [Deltaproteobacteria bacterium]